MKRIYPFKNFELIISLTVLFLSGCTGARNIPASLGTATDHPEPSPTNAISSITPTLFNITANLPEPKPTQPLERTLGPYSTVLPSKTEEIINPRTTEEVIELPITNDPLPPGQYLVYEDSDKLGIQVISADGLFQQTISRDNLQTLLSDEKNENSKYEPPQSLKKCSIFDYSPDANAQALSCNGEVFVLSISTGTLTQVTKQQPVEDHSYQEHFFNPLWSPDGRWISYFNLTAPFEVDPGDGLYLLETSCIATQDCIGKSLGPFPGKPYDRFKLSDLLMQQGYSWSPDSRKIVIPTMSAEEPLAIFDLETKRYYRPRDVAGYVTGYIIAWSPDGEWIAYSGKESETESSEDIFLFSVSHHKTVRLVDTNSSVYVYDWLIVPLPIQLGDTLLITEKGDRLNLHESPALDSKTLLQLHSGDKVQILEGPVDADGYRWWKMQVLPGGEVGWAVDHPDWYEFENR